MSRGIVFLFGSGCAPRPDRENARIFDFTPSNVDMADLDAFDRTGGTQCALERKWW